VKKIAIDDRPVANQAKDFDGSQLTAAAVQAHTIHLATIEQDQEWVDLVLSTMTSWTVESVTNKRHTRSPPVPERVSERTVQEHFGITRSSSSSAASIAVPSTTITSQNGKTNLKKNLTMNQQKNSKFAQEAHEAIRPAIRDDGIVAHPDSLAPMLSDYELRLYTMIYQWPVAYKMPPAIYNQTTILVHATLSNGTVAAFTTSGSVVVDPGFTYQGVCHHHAARTTRRW
jgi:DNA topoisomerase